jgi:hypothetical protein
MAVEEGSLMADALKRYAPDMEPYAREGNELFYVRKLTEK